MSTAKTAPLDAVPKKPATGADAEAFGFDEGPKPADWPAALARRGIRVRRRLLRACARQVLRAYADAGGLIYNPQRGRSL